jgi:hypothetical protein
MIQLSAVLFALFLTSCTFYSNIAMFNGIDPKLQPYFDRFKAETGRDPSFVTAGFTTTIEKDNFVGECVQDIYQAEVRIDPNYWATIENDDILKEQLVFHELGHCVLHEGLILAVNPYTGQPLSIMYPVTLAMNKD